MKYSNVQPPIVCMMSQSTCYKSTTTMKIKGVLWHTTGANNPSLKRYIQPDDDAANRDELIKLIGKNAYNNDWNHITRSAGLNAWIGKLADGSVASVQTMPWDFRPMGCASGVNGSCNDGWIQFEICEDALTNESYFNAVYQEACELTAYLCKEYDIDPKGTVVVNNVTVPTILCHADAHKLGLGSNHADVYHWFNKYNKNMETARNDVFDLLNPKVVEVPVLKDPDDEFVEYAVGDAVQLIPGSKYASGGTIPAWVFKSKLYVREIRADGRILISTQTSGAITGTVRASALTPYQSTTVAPKFTPYLVRVNVDKLNVRAGASTSYKITTVVKKHDIFTIVAENGKWGKLKSGAGWIYLDYTTKV